MSKRRKQTWGVPRIRDPRYPGLTVRVTEVKRGGTLYVIWKRKGQLQKMRSLDRTRADLGATDKEQREAARTIGLDFLPEIHKLEVSQGQPSPLPQPTIKTGEVLTLGKLIDLYELRGSLKASEAYRREQVGKLRRMAAFFGADKPVVSLSESDVDTWVQHRRNGDGRKVGQNTIASDLHALNIALNFARKEKGTDGKRLLAEHPLPDLEIQKEKQPRRPIAEPDRYGRLKKVAHGVSPLLDLALDVVWESGHRIAAVLGLKWQHVIFDQADAATLARELEAHVGWTDEEFALGGILFYDGVRPNNKSYPHVRPMTPGLRRSLERAHKEAAAIGGAWLFPDSIDPTKRLNRWVLQRWLRIAERKAKLRHLKGGAFHPFRRAWATRWKHLPDADAALMGGWRDVETKNRCYTQSDARTRLAFSKVG